MQYNVVSANIPPELKRIPNWVCWRYTTKANGEQTKTPVRALDLHPASSTNPADWTTLELALQTYDNEPRCEGVGFVFTKEAGYVGIDLDDCLNEKGWLSHNEHAWVHLLDSYTEISPSGKGVKVFFKGEIPAEFGRRSFGGNGIYDSGRFFTVTGNIYDNFTDIATVKPETIKYLMGKWFPAREHGKANWAAQGEALTDSEVLTIASRASNSTYFNELYRGAYSSSFSSQSEADAALCTLLAFYAGPNHAQVDRLFRSSGLMRDKWDEQRGGLTYGEKTVEHVIENMDEYYTPRIAPVQAVTSLADEGIADSEEPTVQPTHEKAWKKLIEGYPAIAREEMPLYLRLTVEHLHPLGAGFVSDWLEMSSLGFLSALFAGKKFENLPLNLWTLAISQQATGKSVVGDELDALVHGVEYKLGKQILKYTSGSSQGLVRRLAGNKKVVLAYFSEWSGFAKSMAQDHSSDMREVLMNLYDGRDIYHQLAQETIDVSNPFLSLNGLTTPASWADTADGKDRGTGFYSRFMVILPDYDYDQPSFEMRDEYERGVLIEKLGKHVDNLPLFHQCAFMAGKQGPACYQQYKHSITGEKRGVFDMDRALEHKEQERIPSGRLLARVKKVSALLTLLSESPKIVDEVLYVPDEMVALAIRLVQRAAAYAVRAFGMMSTSQDARDSQRVKDVLEDGPRTMLALLRETGLERIDAQRALELLFDEGAVVSRIENGRKLFVYTGGH